MDYSGWVGHSEPTLHTFSSLLSNEHEAQLRAFITKLLAEPSWIVSVECRGDRYTITIDRLFPQ